MIRKLLLPLAILVTVSLSACGASLPTDERGSIAMMPHFDAERGFRGIVPAGCQQVQVGTWVCEDLIQGGSVLLSQHALSMPLEALIEDLMQDTDIEAPPEPHDKVTVKGLEWHLISFEARLAEIAELMPGLLHFDLALAERDGIIYMVGMVAGVDDYENNSRLCDTLYSHMIHSLRPWSASAEEANDG